MKETSASHHQVRHYGSLLSHTGGSISASVQPLAATRANSFYDARLAELAAARVDSCCREPASSAC